MDLIVAPIYLLLVLYQLVLAIRIIFDITQQYARFWRPKGFALILAMTAYTLTDPPINWLRSKIPPLNLGGISLDLGFIIVFLVVIFGKLVLQMLA